MNTTQHDTTTSSLYEAALNYHHHGVTVIPVRADGTKAPALNSWQNLTPTPEDLRTWFASGRFSAMGVVTGPASGNLELTEIEGAYTHHLVHLQDIAHGSNLADLWERLNTGWVQESPSGGIHWIYRVEGLEVPGNKKIAQDEPRINSETGVRTVPTIAETRGRGGQFVAAPTGGHAHPSGNGWTVLAGGPDTVPTITAEERQEFHTLLSTLDKRQSVERAPAVDTRPVLTMSGVIGEAERHHQVRLDAQGTTPGDDYEERTDWRDILEPAGWTVSHEFGGTLYWTRPGKNSGISATTGRSQDRDRLFVFSSSTEFPTSEPITKFGAYALLQHNGDHSKAAAKLRADGYGAPARVHAPTPIQATPPAAQWGPIPGRTGVTGTTTPTHTAQAGEVVVGGGTPDQVVGNVVPIPAPTPADPSAPLQLVTMTLDLTDDSNAMALIREHGHRLRYDSDRDRWLAWNSHTWEVQSKTGGLVRELAKSVARALPEDGAEGASKTLKHKRYTLSERGITAMLNTARTDQNILVSSEDLDQHPYELNTPTGIVDLRTGELTPPDPTKLHTRTTNISPDPEADTSLWDRFLSQTFPDPEVRDYVQRLVGVSLLGNIHEHILPFAHGSGGNGKGVFLEALRAVLGTYAGSAPAGFLMATSYQQHATELADLQGRRFVIASEINPGDKFDEAKVKSLTGGDTVKARFMRQDFFEFKPTHTIWLMGNDQPAVESGGRAFWRRLRLIPFTHEVPEEDRIEDLQTILATDHGPAVLHWAIVGAVAYLQDGLREPADVKAATDQYAESVDTIGRFLEDSCHLIPGHNSPVTAVRAAYERWCHEAGERPIAGRSFATQLGRHGVLVGRNAPRVRSGQPRVYGGIVIAAPEGTLDAHGGDRGGF